MEKVKRTAVVLLLFSLALFAFAGCGNKGIEGTWILIEEYDASGEKITSEKLKEMGVAEKYEITGTEVKYTCETKLLKKPLTLKFTLEDLGKNRYSFKMSDRVVFTTVEVKGDTMTYSVGEGENSIKMIFKRQ